MIRSIREDYKCRPQYRPWLAEHHPTFNPPDISYGDMIAADQEMTARILENPHWHCKERYLRLQDKDLEVENWIFMAYHEWAEFMVRGANTAKDEGRKNFFLNLEKDVAEDSEEVRKERDMRVHKTAERGQTIYARQGMPAYQWCMCRSCFDRRNKERRERERKRKDMVRTNEENSIVTDVSDGYVTADADTPSLSPV